MICYTSIKCLVLVEMNKKRETNIFFEGRVLVSKTKGLVDLERIELRIIKLVDTQAAPAIFVIGTDLQSDH